MKYNCGIIVILIMLSGYFEGYSQKEYSNWYFGKQAGITFNTQSGEPSILPGNSLIQYEGIATISDYTGNLVLYTNGENVFNSQSEQINNLGDFLKGHQSSTQSAIIVKLPNSSNIFYIFTSDAGEYIDPPNQGINYSIVDMNKMGGRGEVTSLNIPLLATASEKLTSTPHANGRDMWILAKGYGNNNIYAWLLTENGINDTVVTSIGYSPNSKNEAIGYMRVNAKGNKVALVYNEKPFFELLNFDNKTGEFSNLIQVQVDNYYSLYGVEFSPNGYYLYITNSGSMLDFYTIFQYDIRFGDPTSIANSRVTVSKDNGAVGALQLGPNNRIYVAVINKDFLMGITNPDRRCPQCGFTINAVDLDDSVSYMGLPQAIPKYNYSKNILACELQNVQLDPEDFLADTSKYEFSYKWTGPNGFTSTSPRPSFNPVMISDTGLYNLNVIYVVNNDTIKIDFSNRLLVSGINDFEILGSKILCEGEEITLQADTININFSYLWSTGARTRTVKVASAGTYKLYITNNFGCVDSAEIEIVRIPKPKAEIIGSKLLCNNKAIVLSSKYQSDTLSYLWSNGDTNSNISINDTGTYKLIVRNGYGCQDSAEIKVIRIDNLKVKIIGDSVICNPNPANLFAQITPYDSTLKYEYLWSDGQTSSNVLINKPGVISLILTIEDNCVFRDDILVVKTDPPQLELNLKDTVVFCNGDVANIEILNARPEINYYWSNGSKGSKISVSKSGSYTAYASNEFGCTGERTVFIKIKDIVLPTIQSYNFTSNCNTDSIALSVYPKKSEYTYTWSNGMTGDSITITKAGRYFVILKDTDACSSSAEIDIKLGSGINATIEGAEFACFGDTISLRGVISGSTPVSYLWSTGDTTNSIRVHKTDSYSVRIIDNNGCEAFTELKVNFYDIPKAKLNYSGTIDICEGDSLIIEPLEIDPAYNYYWSDGYKLPSRVIRQSGIYKLFVSNKNQCFDSSEVEIIFRNLEKLEIKSDKDPIICDGAEIELSVDLINGISYRWFDGSTSNQVVVDKAGTYYLIYNNEYNCKDSIAFVVESGSAKDFEIIADRQEFCRGDSVVLTVDEDFTTYKWSTGETSKSIIVKSGGNYSVEVIDEKNCNAERDITIIEFNSDLILDLVGNNDFESCERSFLDSIVIINNSELDYTISDIISDNNLEIINKDQLIGIFPKDEQKFVSFKITNPSIGNNSYRIIFNSNMPCVSSKDFEVNYKMRAETIIKLDTLVLESGSISCIPIIYKKICPSDFKINSGFIFSIEIPADYFNPETVTIGTILSKDYIDGFWKLTIRIDDFYEVEGDSLLLKICGNNLIGSNTKKEIRITEFNWMDPNILVTSSNSGLISSISCAIKIRAIQYFRPSSIEVNPNPANEKIELIIATSSIGEHKIKIYNSNADLIEDKIFIYEENQPIINRILLNSKEWQNGIYFVVLESPWGVVNSQKIIVVR